MPTCTHLLTDSSIHSITQSLVHSLTTAPSQNIIDRLLEVRRYQLGFHEAQQRHVEQAQALIAAADSVLVLRLTQAAEGQMAALADGVGRPVTDMRAEMVRHLCSWATTRGLAAR